MPRTASLLRLWRAVGARRATQLLLIGCVLIAVAAEGAARLGFHRASKIQRRFVTEYQHAQAMGRGQSDRRDVLLVGNSLLLEGVRLEQIQHDLSPEWHVERLVSERTAYYDWYYGLKRLLQEGARPAAVVLVLTARQWAENDFRGDYSSHYLVGQNDLPELSRELGWSMTALTNAFVANVSEFWAERAELRNFALQFVVPGMDPLVNVFTSTPVIQPLRADVIEPLLRQRIEGVRRVVEGYGVRLVLVVPPTPPLPGNDGWLGVVRAARAVDVTMVEPLPPETFSRADYRDSFHLNPDGAERYTSLLAPQLRGALVGAATSPGAGRVVRY